MPSDSPTIPRELTMKELNPYLPGGSHRVAKDTLIPDPDLKGFGLRIKPSGAMAWKVYARIRGTTVQLNKTIGTYPEMPPHEAQKIGRKHVMKAQDGKDPFDEPLPATPPPPSKMTVAQLAELYLTNWCAGANRASTLEENARIVATYITPRLGAKLARELLPADVRVFVRGFGKHRVQANRARAVLLRMYSWACDPAEHGDQALLTTNPVAIVKPFPEPPRPRPWTLEQLQAVTKTVAAHPDREAATAVELLLVTAARVGEICRLRWEEIDWERGEVYLKEAKTGSRSVPLSPKAAGLLKALPRGDGPYVFPRYAARKRPNMRREWEPIREAAWAASFLSGRPVGPLAALVVPVCQAFARLSACLCVVEPAHLPVELKNTRSTWVSTIMGDALSVEQGKEQLGHRKSATFEGHYAKPLDSGKARTAELGDSRLHDLTGL